MSARPGARRLRLVCAVLLVALGLGLALRVAWVAYGPRPDERDLTAQVAFLQTAIDAGADRDMQRLFPEGSFFLHALTGVAGARAGVDPTLLRARLDTLESPAQAAVFGSGMVPEHGIFHAGWTLWFAVDVHAAGGLDATGLTSRAEEVAGALATSPTPFLAAYPGQYWPCDTVVAASALARAAQALDRPDWLEVVRIWRERADGHLDPVTGLLPHRVDAAGTVLDGPRGSSQSIIQTFLVDVDLALDGAVDHERWDRFTDAFVTRELGLVGVREHPHGSSGSGDVDSGPLVLGVSASASAVSLAAARRVGDSELASALDREAELLGLPLTWGGERRYGLGLLPVSDAFIAFARSVPEADADPGLASPRPWWELFLALALLPATLGAFLARGLNPWRRPRPR